MQSATPGLELFISIFGIFISGLQSESTSGSYEMDYENIFVDNYEGPSIPCHIVSEPMMRLKSILREFEIIDEAHCSSPTQSEGPGQGARSMPVTMNPHRIYYPLSPKLHYGHAYMLPHRQHYRPGHGQNLYNYPGRTYTVVGPLPINGNQPFTHHQITPNQVRPLVSKKPVNFNFNPHSSTGAYNESSTTEANKMNHEKKNKRKKKCSKKRNKKRDKSQFEQSTKIFEDTYDGAISPVIEESVLESGRKNSANFTSDSSDDSSSSVSDS